MNHSSNNVKPIIFWEGFPVCGLLLKKLAEELGQDLVIVATRPSVPFKNLEEVLGHRIVWLDDANDIWKRKEEFSDRNLIIHTGWVHTGWLRYDEYMKKYYGAKTVVVVDNRYRGNLRQYIGALWFRIFLKKHFDAAFVPGKGGIRLMKFLGMEPDRIYQGNYGAYEGIFTTTQPIENRPHEFLFVGQLIQRKSVDLIIEAFKRYRMNGGTWNLRIMGNGPLKELCRGDGIILEDFGQPYHVAERMNNARVFVLPGRHDNWGTVVCEAAACGMLLLTTPMVGASADIVRTGENGIELKKLNIETIHNAFVSFERMFPEAQKAGSQLSQSLAKNYDSEGYRTAFWKIAHDLLKPL